MYKRILILCAFLLFVGGAYAAKGKVIVTGKVTGFKGGTVSLNYQEYALLSTQEKQEVEVGTDGVFRFDIEITGPTRAFLILGSTPVEEQFTVTKGNGLDTTITTKTNRPEMVYLYLNPKGKQHVEVTLGEIQKTLQITGKNSADSYYLNEEDWQFNQYRDKHLKNYFAYVHYDPTQYTTYVQGRKADRMQFLEQFAKQHKLTKHLKHVSEWTIYGDAVMARLLYPSMRRSYRDDSYEAEPGYYDFLAEVQLDHTRTEKGVAYFYFLDYYLKESYKLAGSEGDYFDYAAEKMSGRPLYEYYAFSLRTNFKRKLYEKFGRSSPYRDLAKRVKERYQDKEGMLEGSPAPLVALQDTSGKSFTFADWKGKYIYIDFWATWCGPCIQEIPFLKELEHTYAEKNLVFVSISMDREKDRQKWIDFVRKENLEGTQVWLDAENNKRISAEWNIPQIPRFVLLDMEGNIFDINAPRPSDKRIHEVFEKIL